MTPLILAALKEELEPLRRAIPQERVRFMRTGVGPERAGKVVRARCTPGSLLISTGCCGGLVEGAVRGMLAVPDRVIWLQEAGVRPAPDPDRTLATAARAEGSSGSGKARANCWASAQTERLVSLCTMVTARSKTSTSFLAENSSVKA